jgi:hypothetical protein
MKATQQIVGNCQMKKEWTERDFKAMKKALKNFFLFKGLQTNNGVKICCSYANLENLLGLPYTSSSSYAGVWVTNSEVISNDYPNYHYIGFAITTGNKCVAILWDKDENEIIISL